jgi:hypothetical protein
MPSRRVVPAGVLACALAVPAAAHAAPTLQPLDSCYVSAGPAAEQRQVVPLVADGFTPNALIDVSVDGEPVAGDAGSQVAGPDGSLQGSIPAPYRRRGQRRFTVTLTEQGTPANSVTGASRITALGVTVRPRQTVPTRQVRFSGRGFTGRGPVYAHYVFGGKLRRTVRMGRPKGACGTFTARRRQIPVRPRRGVWLVQFDQVRAFTDPPESIFVQLQIRVFRTGT